MPGVRNWAKRMPPRAARWLLPCSRLNSSRKMSGKTTPKKADGGLRQNSLFWWRIWRSTRVTVAGRRAPARSATIGSGHPAPAVAGSGSVLVGGGEAQVDVLQAGAGDRQGLELQAAGERPAREGVQRPGRGGGAQRDAAVAHLHRACQLAGQVGRCRT